MTNTLFTYYNRQQALKSWQPIQVIHFSPKEIQYYEQKIQSLCEKEDTFTLPTSYLIELEGYETQKDHAYLKYIALKHMQNLIIYIQSKGIVIKDVEWNIKLLINEILTRQVSEDYYLNTIDIYESIIDKKFYDINNYDLIDEAIRLDNKRMLYYLIFKEDENIADRVFEAIGE